MASSDFRDRVSLDELPAMGYSALFHVLIVHVADEDHQSDQDAGRIRRIYAFTLKEVCDFPS
jgi:hypothetical protein